MPKIVIKFANDIKQNHPYKENFEFSQGDIRKIDFEDEKFDVVYTTRVLINLPTWEEQKLGIEECFRVAKKGGTIICEAFYEPLVAINSIRRITNLPELYEHDFNRYIKKKFDLKISLKKRTYYLNVMSLVLYII